MDNKLITGIIGVVVVVALLGSALVPVIDGLAGGVEYEDNPDWDGWVRFDLNTSAAATYHVAMSQDDAGIYVDNILAGNTDRQTYDDSTTVEYPTIMYADSNMVVWSDDDTFNVMGKSNGNPLILNSTSLVINRLEGGVEVITDGGISVFDVPTWAYVPFSQGKYGFYPYNEDRGVEHPANAPTAVLGGGNIGVYAYNDIYRYNGLGLYMHPVYDDDGLFYGAYWDKTAPVEPESLNPDVLDPAVIDLNPIDIDLDPLNPGAQLMAVPTPTYTDGDWGYDTMVVDGVTYAKIVSYSGAGGGAISIPSTVGGYNVYQIGKGAYNQTVFNTSVTATSLTIPSGVVVIGQSAFQACSGLTGTLTIPGTVTTIGQTAFYNCTGFTGTLTIPDSVTSIGGSAFSGCTGFTGNLVLPNNLTTVEYSVFSGCTGFTGTLTIPDSVTSIGAEAFNLDNFTGQLVLPSNLVSIGNKAFSSNDFTGTLTIPDTVTSIGEFAFNKCNGITGSIILPENVSVIKTNAFSENTGFNGTVVLPSSVSEIGHAAFYKCTNIKSVVIATDTTPTNTLTFYDDNNISEVLDLSDTIDYSVNRYGIPAGATVYDTIGDCFGFVSIVSIAHGSSGVLGGASALLYAIPVVIIAAMLVAGVGWFIGKRY